jgi:guanylate kinase
MLVVVLSGPGGAGKGTIARAVVGDDRQLVLSRSWTTRERRVDDSVDAYVFVSRIEFDAHRKAGGFLEWNEFLGCGYGTPVPDAADERDLLLEIDVAGGRQVLEQIPGALCLFVDAPDDDELRRRLTGRGDGPERTDKRLAEAERERTEADELGYIRVVNGDLDLAITKVRGLIAAARIDR